MTQQGDQSASEESDLQPRIEALSSLVRTVREELQDELDTVRAERDELAESVDELERELREVRNDVDRLDARTDLLRLVESSDDMTGQQRSVALIQHLRRAAEKQRDRGRQAKASVNREEAERALQYPNVDRTTIYDDMRRAERLVDNKDVLTYVSATGGGSRLKLDLEAGDLPGDIVGHRTDHGGR